MKIRLDQYLVQHGLTQSRERAKALIMSGIVFVNEQKVDKAGEMIKEDAKVEVRGHDIGYVSRGGLKLEKAMKCFPLTPNGKVCMDIGASTGGFTDCMLQNGAVKVYAVDVGYGQLAWSLRTDERVVNMERTNIRNVKPEDLAEQIEFFSVDVSFISLHHIFPVAQAITTPDACYQNHEGYKVSFLEQNLVSFEFSRSCSDWLDAERDNPSVQDLVHIFRLVFLHFSEQQTFRKRTHSCHP